MLTVLDLESPTREARRLDPAHPERALGFERKPQGLCRDDLCFPVPDGDLDLAGVARTLGRPIVIDGPAKVAAVGAAPADRGAALLSGQAPDFTLKDLAGKEWTLSQFRGRKVVLYAYASW